MGSRLYVAPQGSAGAIAAAMIHRATAPGSPASVAMVADATGRSSARSRLAAELGTDLHLLDPEDGATALARQLEWLGADAGEVAVVDVGGGLADAVGPGHGARGSCAGAVVLEAVSGLGAGGVVLTTGAGVRAEEAPALRDVQPWSALRAEHVEPFAPVLEWHPSESAGLLALAARGWRGTAERRGRIAPAELTAEMTMVYRFDAVGRWRAGQGVGASPATGRRDRASVAPRPAGPLPFAQALARLEEYGQDAVARGVDFLTMGRVAELLGLAPRELRALRTALRASGCPRYGGAAWALLPASVAVAAGR